MLLKSLKRINIFSFNKFPKRFFPRATKSIPNTNPHINTSNNDNNNDNNSSEIKPDNEPPFEMEEKHTKTDKKNPNFSNSKKQTKTLSQQQLNTNNDLNSNTSNKNNNNGKNSSNQQSAKKAKSEKDNGETEDSEKESSELDLKNLPEFAGNKSSFKKIFKSEKEKNRGKIDGKLSKSLERLSDPSDEDAHFTGEEGDEIDYDSYFDLYSFARINDKLPHIPPDIQDMAKKVFSKHSFKDIRFWTEKFLLNYSQNHACEPPVDLSNLPDDTPKLANSEELNIKLKLFKQLDILSSSSSSSGINPNNNRTNSNKKNKNTNAAEDDLSKSKTVQLDEYHTIDLDDERKLNKEKEHINPIKVVYNQATAVAYLYSRMPYTYQVCKRILNELLFRMPDFKPKSVLDFGAGLGSALWASFHTYEGLITKYAAVEPNRDMRRLGKFLTSSINTETLWVESLTMIPGAGIERGKFDLIFISHVLQEIPTAKLRLMVLETLWNRLSSDGVLVIVEPGSPKGFRFITDIRKWIIEKGREDANIIGPCPHHNACPLADKASTWCHFSQLSYKYEKDVITKTQKEKHIFNEKFTYLAVKKGKIPSVVYQSEQEAKSPEDKSFFWERIIRPVIAKHKHRIVDLCTKRGKFERRVIAKSHGAAGGYKSIKKFNWGDLWYVPLWLPNKFRKERLRGKRC